MEGKSTTSAAESLEIQSHPPSQIFILSEQSNMAGCGGGVKDRHLNRCVSDEFVPSECVPDLSILRLSTDLRWEEARESLHADIDTSKVCGVGPGMAFTNAVRNRLESDSDDMIGLFLFFVLQHKNRITL
ncbi:probable carbohydrate esterase At4g34215 [Raphanus sativus]|uniref:Probable carbohydrate esterase At4g34215 n=1 Tax=Raphanus sativus TaxID=3726 RepID=A0A9W3CVU0_RAPSA|nr:probable carbohydrate esterase At4g34215 [Raphanus sativus]